MPENLLVSIFDINKLGVGTAVRTTIYDKDGNETSNIGHITSFNDTSIEISTFDNEGLPEAYNITVEMLLEELVRIEVLECA